MITMASNEPLMKQLMGPPLVTYVAVAFALTLGYHYVQKHPLPDTKVILGSLLALLLVAYLLRNKLRALDFFNVAVGGATCYAVMAATLMFIKVTENVVLIDEATNAVIFGLTTGLVFTFIGIKNYMKVHY